MINENTRFYRTDQVTLTSQITTTEIGLTTSVFGEAVSVGGYFEMAVVAQVIHNSTNDPGLYLQVSADGGTTWGNNIALDVDMTTTANLTYVAVTNFGDTIRVMGAGPNITTTTSCSYVVKAVLKR